MRLIDADALKELLNKTEGIEYDSRTVVEEVIDNAPTIPQTIITEFKGCDNCELERPKGEWKAIRVADHRGIHDSFVCPFCNYEREYYKKNFCEECGAELKSGQEAKNETDN